MLANSNLQASLWWYHTEIIEWIVAELGLISAVILLVFCSIMRHTTMVLNLKRANIRKPPLAEHFPVDFTSTAVKDWSNGGIPDFFHIHIRKETQWCIWKMWPLHVYIPHRKDSEMRLRQGDPFSLWTVEEGSKVLENGGWHCCIRATAAESGWSVHLWHATACPWSEAKLTDALFICMPPLSNLCISGDFTLGLEESWAWALPYLVA